jgi:hypothetical protein
MSFLRGPSERHHSRVLEEKQNILIDLAGDAAPCEVALELQGNPIGDGSELTR